MSKPAHIGFVSTRFSGTDGVSLETAKWVEVFKKQGHSCWFFAGASEWSAETSYIVPEAHFDHPDVLNLTGDLFDDYHRSPETTRKVSHLQHYLKKHLDRFIDQFQIQLLVVENALSIPMNVPLGLAITELVAERDIPTIAHHHDFSWERSRFSISAADDYLRAAFPPLLYPIRHVVINSYAQQQLAFRTGASAKVIPNVMDFATPPARPDATARSLRRVLNIPDENYLLVQPTRIVPRKRIELAIELARRLDLPCTLLVTHSAGDEGMGYENYLRQYAQIMGVDVRFVSQYFAIKRSKGINGQQIFSLADAYQMADLVTYPSLIEGFGNAFLEAVYYKKPILMSLYGIFKTDIQPKGFQIIPFQEYIEQDTVERARQILLNPEQAQRIVDHNFQIGLRHYSFQVLEVYLTALLNECLGL